MTKPRTRSGYTPEELEAVRSTLLHLASVVGDLMDDIVIVGGLVPSLLTDAGVLEGLDEPHVGTSDLDVGLSLALLDEERYVEVSKRLRRADFEPDRNDKGNPTRQRWVWRPHKQIRVDFLIARSPRTAEGLRIQSLESDWAALVIPGLHKAFEDRVVVRVEGWTLEGARFDIDVWVCGPAAFVVLKSLAFGLRGEGKDAYDLVYVLQALPRRGRELAATLAGWRGDADVARAMEQLHRRFSTMDDLGPVRAARFDGAGRDNEIKAQAMAAVAVLIRALESE